MEEEKKEDIFQSPTQYESSRLARRAAIGGNGKKLFTITFSIIVLGLLIFGVGRFVGGSSSKNEDITLAPTPTQEVFPTDIPTIAEETPSPTPTLKPTVKPTSSPTPKASSTPKPTVDGVDKASGLDRAQLAVHILNGGGVSGASKKAADYLESLGYNVIQIGNAANFDYDKTTIQVKGSKSSFLSLLKKDLSSSYTIGTTSADLGESERASAIVTIGK